MEGRLLIEFLVKCVLDALGTIPFWNVWGWFPFAKCLAWLVECTRNGRSRDLAFPQRAPLLAMQFLNLSAADCGKAAQLHCKLLMLLGRSAPRGLPGRDNDDNVDID